MMLLCMATHLKKPVPNRPLEPENLLATSDSLNERPRMARRQSVPSPISSPQASQRPSTSWKRCCFVAGENDRANICRNGFGRPARLRSCFIGGDLSTFSAADPQGNGQIQVRVLPQPYR
jgi:hypothetical protein